MNVAVCVSTGIYKSVMIPLNLTEKERLFVDPQNDHLLTKKQFLYIDKMRWKEKHQKPKLQFMTGEEQDRAGIVVIRCTAVCHTHRPLIRRQTCWRVCVQRRDGVMG